GRPGRGQLDEAESVAHRHVHVVVEADLVDVERLRAVDIGHRDADEFNLPVHASTVPARYDTYRLPVGRLGWNRAASARKACCVGEPGAAQYRTTRWSVSGTCSTWHSNSSGPTSGCLTRLTIPRRSSTSCAAHIRANSGESASSSVTRSSIPRS